MGNRARPSSGGNNWGPYSGTGKYRYHTVRPSSEFGNNAKAMSISGFEQIIANLNKEILAMTNGSKEGLLHVAKHIRRYMETNTPYIPVDLGNLKASWQTHPIVQGKNHGLLMGFSANYALWVHEMLDPGIKWSKPGSGPKFLEKAIIANHDDILQIIADKTKGK